MNGNDIKIAILMAVCSILLLTGLGAIFPLISNGFDLFFFGIFIIFFIPGLILLKILHNLERKQT
jgi:hypothetical protein